jgi:hypothetical protein
MRFLTLISAMVFGLCLAAWACGPANGVFTYQGGCAGAGTCQSVTAYTLGDGHACDDTDTTSCKPVTVSVTGTDYLPGTCTSTANCTPVLTGVQKSADGGSVTGGVGSCSN